MLDKIKDLIFGLNDYEKTRIELRFREVLTETKTITISKLDDFEVLEKIIYKIKEELRVRSSNLNKVITNPERDLTKAQVREVIDVLEKKKFDFLKHAFELQEKDKNEINIKETLDELPEESQNLKPEIIEDDFREIDIQEKIEKEISFDILKNDDYEIRVENSKIPYISINFFKEVDFVLLKNISSLFFENYSMDGSNIIVERNKALIVPRSINDKLIKLPRIESNLEDVYSKFKKEDLKEKSIEKNVEPITDEEYNEIVHEVKSKETTTTKKQDDSLDSLLEGIESKPNERNNETKINQEPIEEEKVEFIPDEDKVEIEKKDDLIKLENEELSVEKVEPEEKVPEETIKKAENIVKKHQFEIYKDDKIVAYLDKKSKVLGELVVESLDSKNINDVDQNTLTYMSIFSKVFASVIFETLEAHGTNLIWNFRDSKLRIIPRFQGDEIKNLDWEKKESTTDFLDQVKNKLHFEMSKEISTQEKPSDLDGRGKKNENISPIRDSSLEEKGKYILKELRRLP